MSENTVKKNYTKSVKKQKSASDVCPYAKKCGGCDYQGTAYEKQIELKETSVKKLLKVVKYLSYHIRYCMSRKTLTNMVGGGVYFLYKKTGVQGIESIGRTRKGGLKDEEDISIIISIRNVNGNLNWMWKWWQ